MPVGEHGQLTTSEGIHIVYQWSYADAAARTGASGFVAADVGKMSRQLDDNSLWMLTATTPTWVQVGGPAATIDHGGLTGLGDDDHTQYLLLTGARAGATAGPQSFGANGITADNLADSSGGGIAVADDLDMASGADVFPDGSAVGLNARFENLFGDDVPAKDVLISSATFIGDDAANNKLGFETDTTINSDSYTPPSPFSKDIGAGSKYFFVRKHRLLISNPGGSYASLWWSDATAKTKITLQGIFGFTIDSTTLFQEIRIWNAATPGSPGASEDYYGFRWLYDPTTYPDWPYRVKLFVGTGTTWSVTDGTEQVDAPWYPMMPYWLRVNKPNGSARCYLEGKSYIYGDYGAYEIVDATPGSGGFSVGFNTVALYSNVTFDQIQLDSIEIT